MSTMQVKTIDGKLLLTAEECAELLGIHVRTFTRKVNSGDLPKRVRLAKGTTLARWRAADIIEAVNAMASV
jgi:predicted DNA-binding transcriptional regulator AlpA